jgi:hypothetical protein
MACILHVMPRLMMTTMGEMTWVYLLTNDKTQNVLLCFCYNDQQCATKMPQTRSWEIKTKFKTSWHFSSTQKFFLSHNSLRKKWGQTLPLWQKGQEMECNSVFGKIWFLYQVVEVFFQA